MFTATRTILNGSNSKMTAVAERLATLAADTGSASKRDAAEIVFRLHADDLLTFGGADDVLSQFALVLDAISHLPLKGKGKGGKAKREPTKVAQAVTKTLSDTVQLVGKPCMSLPDTALFVYNHVFRVVDETVAPATLAVHGDDVPVFANAKKITKTPKTAEGATTGGVGAVASDDEINADHPSWKTVANLPDGTPVLACEVFGKQVRNAVSAWAKEAAPALYAEYQTRKAMSGDERDVKLAAYQWLLAEFLRLTYRNPGI